jgi:DNA mismatch repair ATPase MutL
MKIIADDIADIVENSVSASVTLIEIIIQENKKRDLYALEIRDYGCGMTKETAGKALEAFFTSRTTKKVGLGLPLFEE